jgi:hypothetical protein
MAIDLPNEHALKGGTMYTHPAFPRGSIYFYWEVVGMHMPSGRVKSVGRFIVEHINRQVKNKQQYETYDAAWAAMQYLIEAQAVDMAMEVLGLSDE